MVIAAFENRIMAEITENYNFIYVWIINKVFHEEHEITAFFCIHLCSYSNHMFVLSTISCVKN